MEFQYDEKWFLKLYNFKVWMTFCATTVSVLLFEYLRQKILKSTEQISFSDHLIYALTLVAYQGKSLHKPLNLIDEKFIFLATGPRRISGQRKLSFLILSLGCSLIISIFCSQAIIFLSNKRIIYPFNDVEDLISNTDYNIAVLEKSLISKKLIVCWLNVISPEFK